MSKVPVVMNLHNGNGFIRVNGWLIEKEQPDGSLKLDFEAGVFREGEQPLYELNVSPE